jgi:hypothetical protein
MPNWVYNTIAVKGSNADLINFLKDGLSNTTIPVSDDLDTLLANIEREGEDKIHMSNFRPIPKIFEDFDTTNHRNGRGLHYPIERELGLTDKFKDIENVNVYLYEKLKLANEKISNLIANNEYANMFAYEQIEEITDHIMKLDTQRTIADRKDVRDLLGEFFDKLVSQVRAYCDATDIQEREYGCVGWYDYNLKHFGTKWDSELTEFESWDLDGDTNVIVFKTQTAWSIPQEWLEYLAEEYPHLGFAVRTYEEQPAWNGFFNVREGHFIENHPYESMYLTNDDGDYEWNEELDMQINDNFDDYVITEL